MIMSRYSHIDWILIDVCWCLLQFKHVPLYLEWAPMDVFSGEKISEVKEEGNNPVCSNYLMLFT